MSGDFPKPDQLGKVKKAVGNMEKQLKGIKSEIDRLAKLAKALGKRKNR
jgi:archaellum component FlaC